MRSISLKNLFLYILSFFSSYVHFQRHWFFCTTLLNELSLACNFDSNLPCFFFSTSFNKLEKLLIKCQNHWKVVYRFAQFCIFRYTRYLNMLHTLFASWPFPHNNITEVCVVFRHKKSIVWPRCWEATHLPPALTIITQLCTNVRLSIITFFQYMN